MRGSAKHIDKCVLFVYIEPAEKMPNTFSQSQSPVWLPLMLTIPGLRYESNPIRNAQTGIVFCPFYVLLDAGDDVYFIPR